MDEQALVKVVISGIISLVVSVIVLAVQRIRRKHAREEAERQIVTQEQYQRIIAPMLRDFWLSQIKATSDAEQLGREW